MRKLRLVCTSWREGLAVESAVATTAPPLLVVWAEVVPSIDRAVAYWCAPPGVGTSANPGQQK